MDFVEHPYAPGEWLQSREGKSDDALNMYRSKKKTMENTSS
jgi:hypothetical protein